MKRFVLGAIGIVSLLLCAAYLDRQAYVAEADTSITMLNARGLPLQPSPIRPDWILEGRAEAEAAKIGQTHDGTTTFLVWRVGAGRFNWFYDFDETISILDGEVYLTDGANAAPDNAAERRLGPGDVIFMHNGSTATWRVPDHVRKTATVRHPLPVPFAHLYALAHSVSSFFRPRAISAGL